MNAKQIEAQIRKDLTETAKSLSKRLLQPTAEWNHKPTFIVGNPTMAGNDLVCRVRTSGTTEGDDEYFFLDEGTKVRKVQLSTGYVRKTHPRSFKSFPSTGRAVKMDNINRPGIEAREWTTLAAAEYGPILQSVINKTLAGYKGKPLAQGQSIGRKYTP